MNLCFGGGFSRLCLGTDLAVFDFAACDLDVLDLVDLSLDLVDK